MYLGQIVEVGAADALFAGPQHPYTQASLWAIPLATPAPSATANGPCFAQPAEPPIGLSFSLQLNAAPVLRCGRTVERAGVAF